MASLFAGNSVRIFGGFGAALASATGAATGASCYSNE
jgi:hypothetical protein